MQKFESFTSPRGGEWEVAMKLRTLKLLRGFAVVTAFLCALLFGAEIVGSTSDYKGFVDQALGVTSGGAGGSAETYAFRSDYESLEEMLTERKRIAEQLSEEGSVLLKNNALESGVASLPLRPEGGETEIRATLLGSRAYTYKSDGKTLRDASLIVYGGQTGSPIRAQSVTLDGEKISLPVTLPRALAEENIVVNPSMEAWYSEKPFSPIPDGGANSGASGGPYAISEPRVTLADVANYQDYSDVCFVMIGRASSEGREYYPGSVGVQINAANTDQTSVLGLSGEERALVEVAKQISENVVVILNSAIPMEVQELQEDDGVDSILWIGLPGSYGMAGVARVISGAVSPSGHLPDTYAVEAKNSPAAQNFGIYGQEDNSHLFTWASPSAHSGADDSHYVVLAEGLYTGYTYYETRYADAVLGQGNALSAKGASAGATSWRYENEVTYPFGYGLSYSTFRQEIVPESFSYNSAEKTVSLIVRVTNTGNYPAKDVVQLYVSVPYTDYDREHGVEKGAIQLIAFGKTDTLYPEGSEEGASTQDVTVTAKIKYFASYDKTLSHNGATGGYILDAGDYCFALGGNAHEALNNALVATDAALSQSLWTVDGVPADAEKVFVWDPSVDTTADDGFSFSAEGVDSSYFALSENGTVVSNQMEDADYNFFSGEQTVTYLSRKDWDATFPVPYFSLEEKPAMAQYLNDSVYEWSTFGSSDVEFGVDHSEDEDENGVPLENMSLAELKLADFDDSRWEYLLSQISINEAWRFAPYGGTNCEPFASVNAPRVWQIDGPNGNINRGYATNGSTSGYLAISASDPNKNYFSADMPCEPTVAAAFNAPLVEDQGKIFGEDNLWGKNPIMWAPGMNLHRTPFNSRNHEYYSEDAVLTNRLGVAFVKGGLEKGSILAAKHFAFNTQESFREGLIQFMEEQSAREKELRAFQGIVEDIDYVNSAGKVVNALGIMTSFSRTGVCNVNAHTGVIKNILRGEWGFRGLISTDFVSAGNYFNPQDCVINNVTFMAASGAEGLLASNWTDYTVENVRKDPSMMTALYDNMHYYMYAIANSSALNGIAPGDVVQLNFTSWWQIALLAAGGVLAAATVAICAVLIAFGLKKKGGRGAPNEAANSDVGGEKDGF